MKVLISGGGTAGHINPALAICDYFKQEKNADILFIGTEKGLESRLVPQKGYPIEYITVSGLARRLTLKNIKVAAEFVSAVIRCKKIMKDFAPDLVIGTGGYVCAPVLYAAHKAGIPTAVHEQNVIPGVTVKMAANFCDKIYISFPETTTYLKPAYAKKCLLTGNPIRSEMLEINKSDARKELQIDDRPFVMAFGGSLGAEALNNAVVAFLNEENTDSFQLLLGTGQRYYDAVKQAVKKEHASVAIVPYIHNMDKMMAAADLVIGRAGALTCSELCALGKASVLVPSPNVAHDHQTYNARSVERAGAAKVITDKELSGRTLFAVIKGLTENPETLNQMGENAKKLGITDGTKRICEDALTLI